MDYIVKFEANCGDEFDVCGFRVMNQAELDDYFCDMLHIYRDKPSFEICFGTNELIYFNGYQDLFDAFTVMPTNEGFAMATSEYFGKEWGFFPNMEE